MLMSSCVMCTDQVAGTVTDSAAMLCSCVMCTDRVAGTVTDSAEAKFLLVGHRDKTIVVTTHVTATTIVTVPVQCDASGECKG